MASKKMMTLRVQTTEGMKRIQIGGADTGKTLYEKMSTELNIPPSSWLLYKDRNLTSEIGPNTRKTIKGLQLGHGDIIYLKYCDADRAVSSQSSQNSQSESSQIDHDVQNEKQEVEKEYVNVAEDEIDVLLSHESGLIYRQKHAQLCHHSNQGKCLNCSPLEPYDEDYLKTLNPPAKHLSFHAYLKKLKSGVSKGKFVSLEDVNCKIEPGCKEHPPWPKGICTKCQPSAVILNRQKYRHVDNLMFENPSIMDRFLNYWRTTGCQRLGYMYGKYEKHDNVPLGIRATVAVIYEPPQESTRDKIELESDPNEEALEVLTSYLGLRKVGWIVTDLIPDESTSGQVKYLRNADTHFLSAQECIMAAGFQNKHPNPCKESRNGKFGSKFVTVVVSGDEDKHIHYDGWQVSNQCMSLVRDECLVPTIDNPALGYIKESTSEQYVPDVFYKEKDSYGNEVTKDSRPMPMEYFLIEVPAGFPLQPLHTFIGSITMPFPIENRLQIGERQDFEAFMNYVNTISSGDMLDGFLDLHFLLFLMTNDTIMLRHKISDLCKALRTRDQARLHQWLESEEWKTVEQVIKAHTPLPAPSASGNVDAGHSRSSSVEMMDTDSVDSTAWTCRHCTFINNPSLSSCDMCSLPRD